MSQDVIIREEDCGTEKGMTVRAIGGSGIHAIETLAERCIGRTAAEDIVNPETGELIVKKNEMISRNKMKKLRKQVLKK